MVKLSEYAEAVFVKSPAAEIAQSEEFDESSMSGKLARVVWQEDSRRYSADCHRETWSSSPSFPNCIPHAERL